MPEIISSKKSKLTYWTFLLPFLFTLILGLGNLVIGKYKTIQYAEVLSEISGSSDPDTITALSTEDMSPMQRLKYSGDKTAKVYAMIRKAERRRDMYQMVTYGGKIFLAFSVFILGVWVFVRNSHLP
jgi:hypothetical protein